MIKGLYETHLFVENLERSVDFYSSVLGLEQCRFENDRRTAFFWIGKPKQFMLGLWEKPKAEVDIRHFAFECEPEWVVNESLAYLKSRNITSWNFLNDGSRGPMVFVWMPAVSIYFSDPDGHTLEFIGILPGTPRPNSEKRIVTYEEWLNLKE